MTFDDNCQVIITWSGRSERREKVTSRAQAFRVARRWLEKGWTVAFSLALIEAIRDDGQAAA